jgi:glucose-6-phosphate isomerase
MKNEFYTITCSKTGNTPETCQDFIIYEVFKVRASGHAQHIPNSTLLNGLSSKALKKINDFRLKGCRISVRIGGYEVGIENK